MQTRNSTISEIQIAPVKPQNGLVAFASLVLDESLYLGSIGILTRPQGGYRLVYPNKKLGFRDIDLYHPINKAFAGKIEAAVVAKYEEVMNQSNDRHDSLNAE